MGCKGLEKKRECGVKRAPQSPRPRFGAEPRLTQAKSSQPGASSAGRPRGWGRGPEADSGGVQGGRACLAAASGDARAQPTYAVCSRPPWRGRGRRATRGSAGGETEREGVSAGSAGRSRAPGGGARGARRGHLRGSAGPSQASLRLSPSGRRRPPPRREVPREGATLPGGEGLLKRGRGRSTLQAVSLLLRALKLQRMRLEGEVKETPFRPPQPGPRPPKDPAAAPAGCPR